MKVQHGLKRIIKHKTDLSFHRTFGAVSVFPDELNSDAGISMPNQFEDGLPLGCTGETTTDISADIDGVQYDPKFTYDKTLIMAGHVNDKGEPLEDTGCDIRQALKSSIVYGLKKKADPDDSQASQNRNGQYFNVERNGDWFDSLRSTHVLNPKRSISIGTPWFPEFERVSPSGLIPPTDYSQSLDGIPWHNWAGKGWTLKDSKGNPFSEPMYRAKSWQGKDYGDNGWVYFSRKDINSMLTISGTGAFTIAKADPNNVKTVRLDIIETILWYITRVLNLLSIKTTL